MEFSTMELSIYFVVLTYVYIVMLYLIPIEGTPYVMYFE